MKPIKPIKMPRNFRRPHYTNRDYDLVGPGYVNEEYSHRKAKRLLDYLELSIVSQMQKPEIALLHDFVKRIGGGNVANLGCLYGSSTVAMAYALTESEFGPAFPGRIFTVDVFKGSSMKRAMKHFEEFGVSELVEICRGHTSKWSGRFDPEFFNFVFIDAGHTYDACKIDADEWGPLVKPGGFMGFHDVHMKSVDKVLKELDSGVWSQVEHCALIKIFKKRSE